MEKWAFCFRNGNIMSAMNASSTQPDPTAISGEVEQAVTPAPNGVPPDLWAALSAYKKNYAAYKVTGHGGFKTAYESALASVNQAITTIQTETHSNEGYIRDFISEYEDTNGELVDLQKKSKQIQKQGPALQDELVQAQQLHSHTVAVADETSLYVKASIVFGLLIIVGIVGAL
jgi:hypothetical protein